MVRLYKTVLTYLVVQCLLNGPTNGYECGRQEIAPLDRIINGDAAVANSWPWVASVRYYITGSILSAPFCAATLISEDYLLTAAHCLIYYAGKKFAVILSVSGSVYKESDVYPVVSYGYHLNYSIENVQKGFDIAFLKLNRSVKFSTVIQPICVPGFDGNRIVDLIDQFVIVIGWGYTTQSGDSSKTLRQAKLKVINSTNCSEFVDLNQLYCAMDGKKFSNVCFGDSGGPMMFSNNARWFLYGIVSFGESVGMGQVCDNTAPSYFTRVSNYLDWMDMHKVLQATVSTTTKSAAFNSFNYSFKFAFTTFALKILFDFFLLKIKIF